MIKQSILKGLLAAVLSITIATIFGSSATYAEAVTTRGLFTDGSDVRWEWEKVINEDNATEPEQVSIMFYDKPAAATTIVVPSLSDVITAASASESLDTYYVRNADLESQAANYTEAEHAKRTSTADVTVLDMTNTSKVQIMGIRPILNPETEAELIFGENMVIGDGDEELKATIIVDALVDVCTHFSSYVGLYGTVYYYCDEITEQRFENPTNTVHEVTDWGERAYLRKYYMMASDLGCSGDLMWQDRLHRSDYEENECYVVGYSIKPITRESIDVGVFAGYKLKLTNLENVKYLGWYAFQNSTFDETSRSITVKANQTAGEGVFASTNVNEVTFEGSEVFPGMFKGCTDLTFENIHFGNVETIGYDAFKDTSLGYVDLSETQVKRVLGFAFQNARVSTLNLGNVEKLDMHAFAFNDIKEVDYPKSIRELKYGVFLGNSELEKITVRFDTFQKTLPDRLASTVGCVEDNSSCDIHIKELNVIAPYAEGEPVSDNHGIAECPPEAFFCYGEGIARKETFEKSYSNDTYQPDNLRNVIAGSYFDGFSMEKLVVGEGYEYIGSHAFYSYQHQIKPHQILEEVILPESLKGIGPDAFENFFNARPEEPIYYMDGSYVTNHKHIAFEFPKHLIAVGDKAFYNGVSLYAAFDLPDLEYIGVSAFENTNINDIVFHNKLVSVGNNSFYYYTSVGSVPGTTIREGKRNVVFDSQIALNNSGVDMYYSPARQAFGKIVFTENITDIIVYNQSSPNVFFYGALFDEIDMSESSITAINPNAFNSIRVKKMTLPKNLLSIGEAAFYGTHIDEELVLPDTLQVIGRAAFDAVGTVSHTGPSPAEPELGTQFENHTGVKITKLPNSLKHIGAFAFYGDEQFTAELNIPNLEIIEMAAFQGTKIPSITLYPALQRLDHAAFTACTDLRSITIDADVLSGYQEITGFFDGGYIENNNEHRYVKASDLHLDSFVVKSNSVRKPFETKTNSVMEECEFGTFSSWSCANEDGTEGRRRQTILEPCEYGAYSDYYCANEDGSRGRRRDYLRYNTSFFYGIDIDEIDLSEAGWDGLTNNIFLGFDGESIKLPQNITSIPDYAFYSAKVSEPVLMPSGIIRVGKEAFQYSNINLANAFAEGLEEIDQSAFYGAEVSGDLVIPSTVTSIGWSAFNAGDADTKYGTVTIKPALNFDSTDSQTIFQLFWNAKMDKLVIESSTLPVLSATGDNPILPHKVWHQIMNGSSPEMISTTPTLREDGEPEFHGMTMKEVEIKNLPVITANAFEECGNLETVSFANHDALTSIERYAFDNDTKLKTFIFGDGLVGKNVKLGTSAFKNTAIETIGGKNADFALTAANFDASDTLVFANLPSLKSVYIPSTFTVQTDAANAELSTSGATIPAYTFAFNPELEEVILDYQVSLVDDGAFVDDDRLAKLFVWGNTEIRESEEFVGATNKLTVPQGATIFAYSDAPAEAYANAESRDNYDGKFYALDEVLYLTTNKTYAVLNDEKDDFDKEGLKLYALRRDGVILQSDNWQEYTTAYPRNNVPAEEGTITFEEGRGTLGSDEADIAAIVYDAEKPFNTISLANQNYANVNFAFTQMPSSNNPLVLINYPDGYTGNIRTTTLASMIKAEEEEYLKRLEEELEVPNTGVFLEVMKVAAPATSLSAIVVAGALLIAKKRKN